MTEETQENRKTVVVSIDMFRNDPNSPMNFCNIAKRAGIDTDEFWVVSEQTRHGSLPVAGGFQLFESEQDAKRYFDANPVGSEKDDPRNLGEFLKKRHKQDLIELIFDDPNPNVNLLRAGEEDGGLVWETLKDSGLNDGLRTSPHVLEFLGEARIEKLKSIHGENWSAAAEMEYCFQNLPSSSSAYVAAQQRYSYYIAQDDFAAGYLQRDLEILVHGVEQAAQKANEYAERQARRAVKGGEANAQKAELRRKTFFKLALSNVASWIWKSDSEQRRYLKKLCADDDARTGADLFQHGTKTLSDQWFDEMLANLRQSGELETVLSQKP